MRKDLGENQIDKKIFAENIESKKRIASLWAKSGRKICINGFVFGLYFLVLILIYSC